MNNLIEQKFPKSTASDRFNAININQAHKTLNMCVDLLHISL
jgi:hypothetical protein